MKNNSKAKVRDNDKPQRNNNSKDDDKVTSLVGDGRWI